MVVPILSSILMGVSIINHPFWGTTILGNPLINIPKSRKTEKAHETNVSWKPVYHGETPVVGTKNISSGKTPAILCCLFCFCGGGGVGENMYNKQAKPAIKGLMGP